MQVSANGNLSIFLPSSLCYPLSLIAAACRAVPHPRAQHLSRACLPALDHRSCPRLRRSLTTGSTTTRLVTDTASPSSPSWYSAPLRSTTLRPVLSCAALPLRPKLATTHHTCPTDRPAPLRPACRNPRASHFHMLAKRHAGLFPAAALYRLSPRLDTSTTTLHLGTLHYTQHTCRALPSRQQTLTTISLLREYLCQQRRKSYYGLGRNRRGKLFLRP